MGGLVSEATIQLAPATIDRAPSIAELSRVHIESGLTWRWRPRSIARCIVDPDTEVVVAVESDALVGFAIARFYGAKAHVMLLSVVPTHRKMGVGRSLMRWLEEMAVTAGVFEVSLEVRATNEGARAFYESLGYEREALVPGYYQGRESAWRMRRDLRRNP